MSVWTEFLQNKKFEIKDDYGIFLHEFRTPMFFSIERDLITYISDTDLKEILYIKFKEDENFKLSGSEKKHQEIINSTEKKKFKNFLIKTLNNDMTFHGSSYPYCVSTTLSFVDIADLTLLNELKELLNKYNVYNVVKDEWYLERYPQFVELLKDMDMKIIKEEQKHLNSIVNTDNKKKVNNRL